MVWYAAEVILPVFPIVNLDQPDEEAVKRSPTPSLLTTKVEKLVLPEIEATERVPAPKFPAVSLNLAETDAWLPNNRSCVWFPGVSAPFNESQLASETKQVAVVQTVPDVAGKVKV